jgi:hypothetical protein
LPEDTGEFETLRSIPAYAILRPYAPNWASLLTFVDKKNSQGAALAAATISGLSSSVRDQVVGTVLFGYTKNLQNAGRIPNYPTDRLKVFCNTGDLVCYGTLTITAAHLSYGPAAATTAPAFLISKVTTA